MGGKLRIIRIKSNPIKRKPPAKKRARASVRKQIYILEIGVRAGGRLGKHYWSKRGGGKVTTLKRAAARYDSTGAALKDAQEAMRLLPVKYHHAKIVRL